MMENMRDALVAALSDLREQPLDGLLNARYARLMGYGKFKETRVR